MVLIYSVVALTVIGIIAAALLYFTAQKFKVEEDERVVKIAEILPGANCGGCGFAGCKNFAEAVVKNGSLDGLACPVGGAEVASQIAGVLGVTVVASEPKVAVVRCSGSFSAAKTKVKYEGIQSCAFANSLFAGESGCRNGCLGCGDCVAACGFNCIAIDPETGLPVVDGDSCVGCGACVGACPRNVIELRNKGPKGRRVFVSCVNAEKGAAAKKNCDVACIGCGKCVKACPFEAITLVNNHAYIDFEKCKLCRKCVDACPTNAIHAVNFPPKPAQTATPNENVNA